MLLYIALRWFQLTAAEVIERITIDCIFQALTSEERKAMGMMAAQTSQNMVVALECPVPEDIPLQTGPSSHDPTVHHWDSI